VLGKFPENRAVFFSSHHPETLFDYKDCVAVANLVHRTKFIKVTDQEIHYLKNKTRSRTKFLIQEHFVLNKTG